MIIIVVIIIIKLVASRDFLICLYLNANNVVACSVNLLGCHPSLSIRPVAVGNGLGWNCLGNGLFMHAACSAGCLLQGDALCLLAKTLTYPRPNTHIRLARLCELSASSVEP
jgi:hypothetical protein